MHVSLIHPFPGNAYAPEEKKNVKTINTLKASLYQCRAELHLSLYSKINDLYTTNMLPFFVLSVLEEMPQSFSV